MELYRKRAISVLLSIFLLTGLACVPAAAAEAHTVCLILRSTWDQAGQTPVEEVAEGASFYLCLDIANNPTASAEDSVAAYDLHIRYETDMVDVPKGCFSGLTSPSFNGSIIDGVMYFGWADNHGLCDENGELQSGGTLAVVEFTAARTLSAADLNRCFTVLDTPVEGIATRFISGREAPFDYLVAPALMVTVGNTEGSLYSSSEADAFKAFLTVQKIDGNGMCTILGENEYSVQKGVYSEGLQTLKVTANDDRTLTRTVAAPVVEGRITSLAVDVRGGAVFMVFDSIDTVKSGLHVEAVYDSMRTETLTDYEITSSAVGDDPAGGGSVLIKAGEQELTISCGGQTETVAVSVAKKNLTAPCVEVVPNTIIYTGQAQEPAFTVWESGADGARQLQSSDYRYEYVNNTSVGTGTVRVTPEENGNYTFGEAAGTFTIIQAAQEGLTIGGMPDVLTYSDEPFAVTVTGGSGNGLYHLTSSDECVLSVANVTNSGGGSTWTVTVAGAGSAVLTAGKAADGNGNYAAVTLEREITVARKTIDSVTWAGAEPRTYDKTASNVTAAADGVKDGDTVAVAVIGGREANAGTYTAMAAALDEASLANYELAGGLTVTYTIHRAPIKNVSIASVDAKTYDGSTDGGGILAVTSGVIGADVDAAGIFSWDSAKAGTAAMTVRDIELTGSDAANFVLPEDMRTITSAPVSTAIAKSSQTPAVPAMTVLSNEAVGAEPRDYTYFLDSITFPADAGVRTYTNIVSGGSVAVVEEGGCLRITVLAAKAAGETDTIQVVIGSENYVDTTAEITLHYVNKTVIPVTLADASIAYGGSYTPAAACPQAKPSGVWTYTYAVKDSGALDAGGRPCDAGTYTVRVLYEDDVPVNGTPGQTGTATATLTIVPKTLTVSDGVMVITKVFDGGTALPAGVHVNALGLLGVLAADKGKVEVAQEAGMMPVYENAAVGRNKRVIFRGLQLTGERSGNYTLGMDTGYIFQKAEITPALLAAEQTAGDTGPSAVVSVSGVSQDHGVVSLSGGTRRGETVTVTVRPHDGYEVDRVTVTTDSGETVSVYAVVDGRYHFIMPGGTVKVEVTYRKVDAVARSFADVSDSYWARDAIRWASGSGYMIGMSSAAFNPEAQMTRQQLWMVLARMAGIAPADFGEAKAWAVDSGISDGSDPGSPVTRQQMAVILYRYGHLMGQAGFGGVSLAGFPDSGAAASYAREALSWAVGNGIVDEAGQLDPGGTTTRGQFAVILQRFCGSAPR